jgi:FkbH-like protein
VTSAAVASRPGLGTVRELLRDRRWDDAWTLLRPLILSGEDATAWNLARNLLRLGQREGWSPPATREIRLGVLCSYEAAELAEYLTIACRALRVDAEVFAAPYGQLEQEAFAENATLAAFAPTHVLVAPTTADLAFPEVAEDADELLAAEEARWTALWQALAERFKARVVQHAFVVPDETVLGHLSARVRESRPSLVRELNGRLGAAAGSSVLLVDCERLAARVGKKQWSDPRLWYAARQPYGYTALPLVARDTAAVIAADVGVAARCVVVDLDNTLWGGVVGDEGPDGIVLGEGPEGEAYAAFQSYLRALKERGVLLAVASKNDLEAAREPFERNPKMELGIADFAAFVADWRRKPEQIAEIADFLGLGLDSLVFVDDNPAEIAEVNAALPLVDTISLDVPPSEFVRTIASSVRFELSALSVEDAARQRSYEARSRAAELRSSASSLPEFWRSLEMRAGVRPVDEKTLERATQLTQKTNQFNLTLVRRNREEVEQLLADPATIARTLELEDRFANHGIIGLAIARPAEDDPTIAVVDTLLLSCRVIGRTAEAHLLAHVAHAATQMGFQRLRGLYVTGPRNGLVADLYPRLGFAPTSEGCWEYDLVENGPIESPYIAEIE